MAFRIKSRKFSPLPNVTPVTKNHTLTIIHCSIGSSDLEDFVASAINMQGTATISPVEGVAFCRPANGADGAQIEWTLCKPL